MSLPLTSDTPAGSTDLAQRLTPVSGSASERVSALRERMNGMQRDRWEPRGKPMPGGLAALLPNGILRSGVAYTVENSTSLIMAVLSAATADGGWAAVVGLPDFGAEAAAGFGIDLERTVFVPSPGDQWLAVTAALVDVLPVVVVHPERTVGAAEVTRLGARLRQTGCTLLVAGAWPQSEAVLRVTGTSWEGLGDGHGFAVGRDLTVSVADRGGPRHLSPLHLPEAAPVDAVAVGHRPATAGAGRMPRLRPVAG